MRLLPLAAGAAVGAAAFLAWRTAHAAPGEDGTAPAEEGGDAFDWLGVTSGVTSIMDSFTGGSSSSGWSPDTIPAQYADAIATAERTYGLPSGLLARVLWQESRYNPNARSPAGALGIAQFMPATAAQLGIDPMQPMQAIDAAGRYLRSLYNATGNWRDALAAYNWGIGNLQRQGIDAAPAETRNYYTSILADLGLSYG